MKRILESDKNAVKEAADQLKSAKVISFATDTVYGFAVDASSKNSVDELYKLKKRDKKKPIAIFLSKKEDAKKYFEISEKEEKIIENFMPGAITLVVKKRSDVKNLAQNLNLNDDYIGFRIVKSDFLEKLLAEFGGALAVTSANISGANSTISADEVFAGFSENKDLLLIDGGICKEKIPSTVVKIENNSVIILREGAVNSELIKNI